MSAEQLGAWGTAAAPFCCIVSVRGSLFENKKLDCVACYFVRVCFSWLCIKNECIGLLFNSFAFWSTFSLLSLLKKRKSMVSRCSGEINWNCEKVELLQRKKGCDLYPVLTFRGRIQTCTGTWSYDRVISTRYIYNIIWSYDCQFFRSYDHVILGGGLMLSSRTTTYAWNASDVRRFIVVNDWISKFSQTFSNCFAFS